MAYTVRLKPRAEQDLDRLPLPVARRIWQKLLALEQAPRPHGAIKLEGSEGYRIRMATIELCTRLMMVEVSWMLSAWPIAERCTGRASVAVCGRFLDHLVIGETDPFSFKTNGLL